ncbi:hypothetical protein LINGRAHAP2_LOCUS30252 [Linum grandiflorum]
MVALPLISHWKLTTSVTSRF